MGSRWYSVSHGAVPEIALRGFVVDGKGSLVLMNVIVGMQGQRSNDYGTQSCEHPLNLYDGVHTPYQYRAPCYTNSIHEPALHSSLSSTMCVETCV